jgi:hypothetical protein
MMPRLTALKRIACLPEELCGFEPFHLGQAYGFAGGC